MRLRRPGSARGVAVAVAAALLAGASAASAQGSSETASQFYMRYRAAFDKAKAFEEIAPFMSAKTRKDMESRPADQRKKMFAFVQVMSAVKDAKVVKEEKTAAGATLTVEAISTMEGGKTTGTITLVREDGAWKVDSESWSS